MGQQARLVIAKIFTNEILARIGQPARNLGPQFLLRWWANVFRAVDGKIQVQLNSASRAPCAFKGKFNQPVLRMRKVFPIRRSQYVSGPDYRIRASAQLLRALWSHHDRVLMRHSDCRNRSTHAMNRMRLHHRCACIRRRSHRRGRE